MPSNLGYQPVGLTPQKGSVTFPTLRPPLSSTLTVAVVAVVTVITVVLFSFVKHIQQLLASKYTIQDE
jgi:hypothetical protein